MTTGNVTTLPITWQHTECDYFTNSILFIFLGVICGCLLTLLCTFVSNHYEIPRQNRLAQMEENRHDIMTAMD